jgi:hypothetical protein
VYIRTVVLATIFFCSFPILAREKTDVLVMNNGDHITCEVKGLDAGVLYVSVDYVDGTVLLDWSKVIRLDTQQLFVVKTEDGSVYMGKLRTAEGKTAQPVQIQVKRTAAQQALIPKAQIVRMVATSDKIWQRFSGEVSLGSIYSKGNQSTQYTLGSQVAYIRERWDAQASFASSLSASSGVNVSTHNSFDVSGRHLLPWSHWFYSGIGGLLQSSEQGITLQSTLGAGVGRYLKNTNKTTITLLGGVAWQNTRYNESVGPFGNQNVAAGLVSADLSLFKFSKTNLHVTGTLLPAISDPGRFRFNTESSYYVKLFKNLKWNISFYGNWDNQPPPGLSGSDYGTSSGVSWTFGLK